MREVELKAVVTDADDKQRLLTASGAKLSFEGALHDRRYDTPESSLSQRDEVIRVRTYSGRETSRTLLDWKGPADVSSGFKVREEISTVIGDAESLVAILGMLGYVVIREIDRQIAQYDLGDATVRFEFYPRMDTLVEVEGNPAGIERAIEALGMSRGEFTSEPLGAFVTRFERRTGVKAAISDAELGGDR